MNISNRNEIELKNKNVIVIGLGKSGCGAAKLAHYLKANVFVSDQKNGIELEKNLSMMKSIGVDGEIEGHSEKIFDADLWVISPGVPQNAPIIVKAKERNIPIVGEIEFSSWFTSAPILAITGSNGKTTTAHALTEMCKTKETHGVLAGNVGIPFSEKVLEDLKASDPKRIFILEISSFQMEFILHFKPLISLFLNITPDHLDRYETMEEYESAKLQMIQNQSSDDMIVFNADDPCFENRFDEYPSTIIPFSLYKKENVIFSVNQSKIYTQENDKLIYLNEIALPGKHNLSNLLAAATVAHFMQIPNKHIEKIMATFTGVPHRLEPVVTLQGVDYVNDSKATNIDSVKVALDSFNKSIILILGGQYKGGNFEKLLPHANNIKAVLAYGQAHQTIETALGDAVRLYIFDNLKDAVSKSQSLASPGDIVLLSPGCASFDQFDNFEHRGDLFKQWVSQLEEQK